MAEMMKKPTPNGQANPANHTRTYGSVGNQTKPDPKAPKQDVTPAERLKENDKKNADNIPQTHTAQYGSSQPAKPQSKAEDRNDLHEAAVKAVKDKNGGDVIMQNPNYDALVKDAEDQISRSIEMTKDM